MGFAEEFARKIVAFGASTPWLFASSAGVSGGAVFIGASGGKLYLQNSETNEKPELWFAAAGGSAGAPVAGSYSTPSMWSTGIGNIRQRGGQGKLAFGDLQGPTVMLVGASILIPGVPAGLSASVVFLGVPYLAAVQLYSSSGLDLLNVIMNARAVGIMVGEFRGLDVSVGVLLGYAR